jgi:hypothetical protein
VPRRKAARALMSKTYVLAAEQVRAIRLLADLDGDGSDSRLVREALDEYIRRRTAPLPPSETQRELVEAIS